MTDTGALDRWITYLKPKPQARIRVFCFPHAGGSASLFCTWSDKLPIDIEVYPVQLPGRENRLLETPFTRLAPLVETAAKALFPYLDKPFVFFGHSMGALVSFELARQIRREYKLKPVHLFVSACRAPQIPAPDPHIHHLPEPEFLEELHRINGTPEAVLGDAELMQIYLPILRADFAVCETYDYVKEHPLDCPVSAFGGLHDQDLTRDDLEAWGDQTTSFFRLRMIPDDHFFLNTSQPLLLQVLYRELCSLQV